MHAGAVSGLLWGITPLIWFTIWDLNVGLVGEIRSALVFFAGAIVYEYEARKIPRIVAEVNKELGKAREQAEAGKFFCRYCGTENKSDAVFCEKCGKKNS